MTTKPSAPPLPKPQHPAVAARAVADAAHIAAYIWARPLDPARHGRAISQLYSTLRDLGIADIESAVYGDPRDRMRGYDPDWWRRRVR